MLSVLNLILLFVRFCTFVRSYISFELYLNQGNRWIVRRISVLNFDLYVKFHDIIFITVPN